MNYTIYDPTTGAISGHYSFTDTDLIDVNLQGKSYIQGKYSHTEYYIANNAPVLKPEDPSNYPQVYSFNYESKSYQYNQEASQTAIRTLRNKLLHTVDNISPVRYSTLSDQQKSDVVAYRQALLDVPQQQGFPTGIMWPSKPEWL